MKQLSILFLTVTIFSLVALPSIAQCHVETKNDGDFGQVYSRPELFYKSGYKTVLGNIIYAIPLVDTTKKMKYLLKLAYVYTGDINRVKLRQITIKFKNKKQLTIKASALDIPVFNNGVNTESSFFSVDGENYNQVMNDPLESITVTDTRTKKFILMKPYEKILIEQNNCIAQKLFGED